MNSVRTASLDQVDPKDIWQKDHDHFLHPWTHFDSFKKDGSMILGRAEGVHVYDLAGKKYLDGIGGLWCVNMGYGRREIVDAIAKQAERLAYFNPFVDMSNVPAAELAARLAGLAPGNLNHVFFTCGGSTANDSAVRIVHYYHARRGKKSKRLVLARIDGYHGSTYLTGTITGRPADRSPYLHFADELVHHVASPNFYRAHEIAGERGMSEAEFCDFLIKDLEKKILALGPDNVACFFAEPLLGAGGVIVPPKDYHKRALDLCHRHDIVYISDEVVTGFGRLGHFFASRDEFGITPDIITCAKGLTSGYQPLGACILSDAMYDAMSAPDPDGWLTNGYTYSGHPVACAAGLANIDLMEREDICGHVRKVGTYFEEQLKGLLDLPSVGDVRGRRFMMCVENVMDKETRAHFPESVNIGKRIAKHCGERGLIVRPLGAMNVLSPPLVMTKEDVDTLVGTLRQAIEATMADLRKEGHWKG